MALRSFLFAPGNHARRVEKALTLPADAVILDLEDAVAISEKPATRELVVAVFGQPRHGRLYVRVNAYTTGTMLRRHSAIVRWNYSTASSCRKSRAPISCSRLTGCWPTWNASVACRMVASTSFRSSRLR